MSSKSVSPEESCDTVLTAIRHSKLHFMIQESPFSLYVTIRKKFSNQSSGSSISQKSESLREKKVFDDNASEETNALLKIKETELSRALETIRILKANLENSEASLVTESNRFSSCKQEFKDEIKLLKDSIKRSKGEESRKSNELSEINKIVKAKEKENYNLNKRIDNFLETTRKLRENIGELKKHKTGADKNVKIIEKKLNAEKEKWERKVKIWSSDFLIKLYQLVQLLPQRVEMQAPP